MAAFYEQLRASGARFDSILRSARRCRGDFTEALMEKMLPALFYTLDNVTFVEFWMFAYQKDVFEDTGLVDPGNGVMILSQSRNYYGCGMAGLFGPRINMQGCATEWLEKRHFVNGAWNLYMNEFRTLVQIIESYPRRSEQIVFRCMGSGPFDVLSEALAHNPNYCSLYHYANAIPVFERGVTPIVRNTHVQFSICRSVQRCF